LKIYEIPSNPIKSHQTPLITPPTSMIKSMMNPLRTLMNVEELPKGWSVGQALELRDGDKGRLLGKGVLKARKVSKPWDGRIFLGPFAMKQGEALTFEE
jgi:hypothetical protein